MSRQKRVEGSIVQVPLGDGWCAFGRVLEEPLMGFYDLRQPCSYPPSIDGIIKRRVLFKVWVMNHAVTRGTWPVIGNRPLEPDLREKPWFFKKDKLSGRLFRTRDGGEDVPATREECRGLEAAAVWDPLHVVDRLNDAFAGRENQWVKLMEIK